MGGRGRWRIIGPRSAKPALRCGMARLKRDKQKVVEEVWDDARVRGFLDKIPPDLPGDPDFHVLLFAYRSMRANDFERFLRYFKEAGRNVSARNGDGVDLARYIAPHAGAEPYIALLEAAGSAAA